jgi:drug/metabolite transporter (DMT)-like permease
MMFWIGGFKYTKASIAAILNQTSVIFAMALATVVLGERLTLRKGTALALALCGVVVVTLKDVIEKTVGSL